MTKYKAKFIVLEGIDGTGKTTTAQKLEEYYISLGKKVFLYHEPYKFASFNVKEIIKNFEAEGKYISDFAVLSLMIASRDISVNNILIPALNEYDIVIADRYYYSTYAYQKEIIENTITYYTDYDFYLGKITEYYPIPNKVLLFDIVDFNTYQNSKSDRFELQDINKLKKIQTNYHIFFKKGRHLLDKDKINYIEVNQNAHPYFNFNQVLQALEGI